MTKKKNHTRGRHHTAANPARTLSHATQKSARRQTKKSKKYLHYLPFLLAAIFVAILSFAGLKIVQWHLDNLHTQQQQEETADDANGREVSSEGELVNPPDDKESDYWYFIGLPFYEVDFNELKARNPDTVAFIHMRNNNVNYPVVQTTDNDYYLHHAFDGSYNDAGWVYMDYRSSLNPHSENTVIYGHGRYDGTVFGSLRKSITPEWQADRDNFAIWLSTPSENLMYQIFSIYSIPAEGYYLKQNFRTSAEKTAWLDTIKGRNTAPIDIPVSASDPIITLSTCLDDFDNRVVVHARLIKRQPR